MMASYRLVSFWDMLLLPIGRLLAQAHTLATFQQLVEQHGPQPLQLEASSFNHLHDTARGMVNCCEEMGLAVTEKQAAELLAEIEKVSISDAKGVVLDAPTVMRVKTYLTALSQCLKHESATKVAMILSPEKSLLFDPPAPLWGSELRGKFPGASKDIDEAAKCLALGRYTAAVFHSMRILEVALRAIRLCLQATNSGRNWGDVLKDIRDERTKRGGAKWPKNDYFQNISARLDAIKDAWRNTTMHVENVYTEEDASRIFDYTKGLMSQVALEMDENGLPLA